MLEILDTAALLGLALPHAEQFPSIGYLDLIAKGLSVKSLERLSSSVAPDDASFKYRIVPKASLARATTTRRLNHNQSVVVTRLATIWSQALRIWKSEEAAREFLFTTHPLLADRKPIDLILDNEIGAALVRDLLGRLEAGVAA
jgi:putative toxin-antitoxin system antitoxin component (TIGR02293 family)